MRRLESEREHRFFRVMSIVATAVVFTGFARTYPGHALSAPGLPAIIHVHAAVFACWFALFVVQVALVTRGRIDAHRRLGTLGMALAGAMLALGTATAVAVARLGHRGIPGVEFPDPEGFLLLNLASTLVFALLAFAGWWFRNDPRTHKRLMLMATVGGLMPPGIARLPFVAGHTPAIGVSVMAFLLAGPVYDLTTRRRVHVAYVAGLLASLATIPPIVAQLSASGGWHRIAQLLISR
jgi:hypothetical protein